MGRDLSLPWYISALGKRRARFPLSCCISLDYRGPWGQDTHNSLFRRNLAHRLAHGKTSTNVCWANEGKEVSIYTSSSMREKKKKKTRTSDSDMVLPSCGSINRIHIGPHGNGLRSRFWIPSPWRFWFSGSGLNSESIFLTNAQMILMHQFRLVWNLFL